MKKRFGLKAFIYFICVSFLLMMNGFPVIGAEAKERGIPIGEMVSKGEVKFEARENVWKEVESSHFPIFQGTRIKTGKGVAIITLSNNSQIEVGPNSLFHFDQNDRFILSQGNIEFRMPPSSEINFKAGDLSILKYRVLQATKNPSVSSPKDEETMGSISIHSNGSVTVKSIQGKLSILNQDRVILAALSSKESLTIPNTTVKGPSRVMVAQAPPQETPPESRDDCYRRCLETPPEDRDDCDRRCGGFLGLSSWDLIVAVTGTFAFATLLTLAAMSKDPKERPRCVP